MRPNRQEFCRILSYQWSNYNTITYSAIAYAAQYQYVPQHALLYQAPIRAIQTQCYSTSKFTTITKRCYGDVNTTRFWCKYWFNQSWCAVCITRLALLFLRWRLYRRLKKWCSINVFPYLTRENELFDPSKSEIKWYFVETACEVIITQAFFFISGGTLHTVIIRPEYTKVT